MGYRPQGYIRVQTDGVRVSGAAVRGPVISIIHQLRAVVRVGIFLTGVHCSVTRSEYK